MEKTWEVEQKYVVEDAAALRAALVQCGLVSRGVETHRDIYLKHPSRNFRETDEALRVRVRGDSACVTYKGPRLAGPVKTRPEIELEIVPADVDSWLAMYVELGFTPVPEVRKTRHIYQYPAQVGKTVDQAVADISLAFDEVEQLGTFAEIELIVTDTQHLDTAHQQIQELAAQLGLTQVQAKSYLSQLLHKLGIE